jgi:hypothetical protein
MPANSQPAAAQIGRLTADDNLAAKDDLRAVEQQHAVAAGTVAPLRLQSWAALGTGGDQNRRCRDRLRVKEREKCMDVNRSSLLCSLCKSAKEKLLLSRLD